MIKLKLENLIGELKKHQNSDYYIDLYYKGISYGAIYGDDDFESLVIEDRDTYALLYNDGIRVLVDDANLTSI